MVFRTGRAARMVSYENASGSIAARFRDLGMRTAVDAPIIVGLTHPGETLPPDPIAQPALSDRESAMT
jgi:hypothetical protein